MCLLHGTNGSRDKSTPFFLTPLLKCNRCMCILIERKEQANAISNRVFWYPNFYVLSFLFYKERYHELLGSYIHLAASVITQTASLKVFQSGP